MIIQAHRSSTVTFHAKYGRLIFYDDLLLTYQVKLTFKPRVPNTNVKV
jgi:hypothetical protein